MMTSAWMRCVLLGAIVGGAGGCMVASRAELEGVESRNRVLLEQHRAHLTEIENLKVHGRNTEDQLAAAEQKLALLDEKLRLQDRQFAAAPADASGAPGKWTSKGAVNPSTAKRFEQLAQMYPALKFDAQNGVGRLDGEILFDSGRADIKEGARATLQQLGALLKSPEGRDLRVLVVGHTDDRPLVGAEVRQQFVDNVALSTSRAKAVADALRGLGLEDSRLGVAGFGPHQPLAANATLRERQKNRRVEVFVMAPEAPIVGWTESVPSLY